MTNIYLEKVAAMTTATKENAVIGAGAAGYVGSGVAGSLAARSAGKRVTKAMYAELDRSARYAKKGNSRMADKSFRRIDKFTDVLSKKMKSNARITSMGTKASLGVAAAGLASKYLRDKEPQAKKES